MGNNVVHLKKEEPEDESEPEEDCEDCEEDKRVMRGMLTEREQELADLKIRFATARGLYGVDSLTLVKRLTLTLLLASTATFIMWLRIVEPLPPLWNTVLQIWVVAFVLHTAFYGSVDDARRWGAP